MGSHRYVMITWATSLIDLQSNNCGHSRSFFQLQFMGHSKNLASDWTADISLGHNYFFLVLQYLIVITYRTCLPCLHSRMYIENSLHVPSSWQEKNKPANQVHILQHIIPGTLSVPKCNSDFFFVHDSLVVNTVLVLAFTCRGRLEMPNPKEY